MISDGILSAFDLFVDVLIGHSIPITDGEYSTWSFPLFLGEKMGRQAYLEGANPYPSEAIKEYTEKGWWVNLTYGDILDRSAAGDPSKIAVIDDQTRLTYAQLKNSVDRFAIALHLLGIKEHDRILIQLPNRHEFLIAYYGMQRIGAVPVLAVPRHDYREISHFFNVIEPVGWILPMKEGKRDFLPLINRIRAESNSLKHLITLENGGSLPENTLSMDTLIKGVDPGDYPEGYLSRFRPDPNDVAVILLTGGTTGLPKGVPRTHNSYLANIRYTNADLGPEDVRGLATPIGHSMAHQGPVGGSIFYGATLSLISVPRAGAILEAIERDRITVISFVPTQLEDILNDQNLNKYDLSSLRKVGTTGAALRPDTAHRAMELFKGLGAEFRGSAFGSSEGPSATHRPGESPEVFRNSIGRPLCEGDHWKVIDEQERELPTNSEGELVAKGPSVFRGYYKSEAENKEIFTKEGYYKMGDLGRIDEEGHIFITGRKKDIIQRGGEGIIPSEIEKLIQLHPHVECTAVVGMPDPRLGERACCYVVPRPGAKLTFEEMVDFLKAQGAGVMLLPERLEIVESLPRTAVGKIDKEALRADIRQKLEREGGI